MDSSASSSSSSSVRRRERTRSESGKENSSVTTTTSAAMPASSAPVGTTGGVGVINATATSLAGRHQRRSGPAGLRERYTEATLASAVAALSAADTDDPQRVLTDSPVEFCVTDSALPSDSDHGGPWGDQHSSEEELECINGPEQLAGSASSSLSPSSAAGTGSSALRFGPSAFGPPGDASLSVRRGKTPQQVRFFAFCFPSHRKEIVGQLSGPAPTLDFPSICKWNLMREREREKRE